jgi:hypothetical protein
MEVNSLPAQSGFRSGTSCVDFYAGIVEAGLHNLTTTSKQLQAQPLFFFFGK